MNSTISKGAISFLLLLCTASSHAIATEATAGSFAGQVLHILTWSDYLDAGLVAKFEERFKAKLRFTYFETDEHRDRMIANQGPDGYDLAIINLSKVPVYAKRGWIDRLDQARIPNLAHMDSHCLSGSPDADDYFTPYFWGTLGIVYRNDLVKEPITHWMQLYKPAEELKGKIVMIDDSWEVLGMAAKALGKSLNSESTTDWEAAAQLAGAQKPHVQSYGYIAIDEHSGLILGKSLAAQIYNGEALALQEHNEHVSYAHPKEGSSFWVDGWALFHTAPQRALAHAFLNYINDPENAAANAQSVYFATCNKAAEALLPQELLDDPIVYPPPEVMQRLEPYKTLPPRITRKMNLLYSQIVERH